MTIKATYTIVCTGEDEDDLEFAFEEGVRMIREGYIATLCPFTNPFNGTSTLEFNVDEEIIYADQTT